MRIAGHAPEPFTHSAATLCATSAQPQSAMVQQKSSNQTDTQKHPGGAPQAPIASSSPPKALTRQPPKASRSQALNGPMSGSNETPSVQHTKYFALTAPGEPSTRWQMPPDVPAALPIRNSHTQLLRWLLSQLQLRPEPHQQQFWQQHLPVPSTPAGSSLAKRGMKQPGTWPSAPGSGGTAGR